MINLLFISASYIVHAHNHNLCHGCHELTYGEKVFTLMIVILFIVIAIRCYPTKDKEDLNP
jgi:cell division protein FtsL